MRGSRQIHLKRAARHVTSAVFAARIQASPSLLPKCLVACVTQVKLQRSDPSLYVDIDGTLPSRSCTSPPQHINNAFLSLPRFLHVASLQSEPFMATSMLSCNFSFERAVTDMKEMKLQIVHTTARRNCRDCQWFARLWDD